MDRLPVLQNELLLYFLLTVCKDDTEPSIGQLCTAISFITWPVGRKVVFAGNTSATFAAESGTIFTDVILHGLGGAAWTWTSGIDLGMQHGQLDMDTQHILGHAAWPWTCSMNMDMLHEHQRASRKACDIWFTIFSKTFSTCFALASRPSVHKEENLLSHWSSDSNLLKFSQWGPRDLCWIPLLQLLKIVHEYRKFAARNPGLLDHDSLIAITSSLWMWLRGKSKTVRNTTYVFTLYHQIFRILFGVDWSNKLIRGATDCFIFHKLFRFSSTLIFNILMLFVHC
jgi:hypothetical protein